MIQFGSPKKNKARKDAKNAPRRRQSSDYVRTPATPAPSTQQFRRNQTMSGVRRPDGEPVSERARMHKLAKSRRRVGAIFGMVFIVIILLAVLISQFTAKVLVTGSSAALSRAIEPGQYEKVITEYLGLHPVERLRFALNETALSQYVAAAMPEVATVALTSTSNIVEGDFTLSLRRPVAGWQINSHQYYVDTNGVVFQNNYYQNPSVQIIDQSGVSPEQGSTVASARLLSFVGRVVALSGQGSYSVTEAILPSGTTRQIEIRLKDVQPLIKFSIDRGAGEQVEDMIRALTYLKSQGQDAQYIDVRVSGRAAYL